jgi:hypothetical protein
MSLGQFGVPGCDGGLTVGIDDGERGARFCVTNRARQPLPFTKQGNDGSIRAVDSVPKCGQAFLRNALRDRECDELGHWRGLRR